MDNFKVRMDNLFGNTQTRMREVDQVMYQELLDIRDRLDELEGKPPIIEKQFEKIVEVEKPSVFKRIKKK